MWRLRLEALRVDTRGQGIEVVVLNSHGFGLSGLQISECDTTPAEKKSTTCNGAGKRAVDLKMDSGPRQGAWSYPSYFVGTTDRPRCRPSHPRILSCTLLIPPYIRSSLGPLTFRE